MTTFSLINLISATRNPDQPTHCEVFRQNSILRELGSETVLYRQGDKVEWVYFLESGMAKYVQNSLDGEEMIVGIHGVWSLLGCASVTLNRPHSETAVLLCSAVVRGMPVERFRSLLRENLVMSQWLNRCAALELSMNLEHQLLLRDLSARSRVESFYRLMVRQAGGDVETSLQCLSIPMKQIEIAQFLGITPEHLSRVTRGLENDGVLRREKSGKCTVNPRLLQCSA